MKITLGIDLAKATFDAALIDPQQDEVRYWHLDRSLEGYQALLDDLAAAGYATEDLQVGMEATGSLWLEPMAFFDEQGAEGYLLNPQSIYHKRRSRLGHHKNDRQDAWLIAHYVRTEDPDVWVRQRPELEGLRAMMRRLVQLKTMLQQEKNRLKDVPHELIRDDIEASIVALGDRIKVVFASVKTYLKEHAELAADVQRVKTIPGVGLWTACVLVAELGDVQRFASAKKVASMAGVVPSQFESGTSVAKPDKLTPHGNRYIRRGLYMAALVAMRFNPAIIALNQRLKNRKQPAPGKARVVAAMHKLIRQVYAVLRDNTEFDLEASLGQRKSAG